MNITIPLKSLRLPIYGLSPAEASEEKEGEMPQVNDPVSFNAEGIVSSIKGENAMVEIRFLNGERPGQSEADEEAEEPKEPTEEEEDDYLSKAAEKADEDLMK